MQTEHRKNYRLGVSPGEWITVIVIIASVIFGYSTLIAQANGTEKRAMHNTEKLETFQKNVTQQIQQSEARTRQEIQRSEQRTREDIKELRQLIIRGQ